MVFSPDLDPAPQYGYWSIVTRRMSCSRQNTASRGFSSVILRQNPPLESKTTARCQSSGVARITASTIFRPQPLTAEVSAEN
jgi:hypothetical protein